MNRNVIYSLGFKTQEQSPHYSIDSVRGKSYVREENRKLKTIKAFWKHPRLPSDTNLGMESPEEE